MRRAGTAALLLCAVSAACGSGSASVPRADDGRDGGPPSGGADAGASVEPGADSGTGTGSSSDAGSDAGSGDSHGSDGGTASDGGALTYRVTDLGPAVVYSIDPKGRVAGNALLPSGVYGGAIYTPGDAWS